MRSGADLSRSSTDMLRGAAEHLRRALLERPTSPNAWANLALAKLFLAELDEEMFRASPREPNLRQAMNREFAKYHVLLIRDLQPSPREFTHAIQPRYRYRHVWRKGDMVIWDNRSVLHKANGDYDMREGEGRLMYRLMLTGPAPTAAYQ